MPPSWQPEHVVGPDEARALIAAQFPELRPVEITALGVGWDNTVYLVNRCAAFRFPRRQIAVDLLETEWRLLPELAPRLPLPIPTPRWRGEPTDNQPWPFVGYDYLVGRTADRARLSAAQRRRLAEPLARFLAALHSFPVDAARRRGVPGDVLGRLELGKRIAQTRANLAKLNELMLLDDAAFALRMFERLPDRLPSLESTLVHGDLYARHLLVDDAGMLSGVIDWGDVHVGHPALDLSIAHGLLPPEAHATFRAAYGPIDEATWRLAAFRALQHATVTTTYAHATGDETLLNEGLQVLEHVRHGAA